MEGIQGSKIEPAVISSQADRVVLCSIGGYSWSMRGGGIVLVSSPSLQLCLTVKVPINL